jgi:predicted CXXCH cytochrome family protein
MAAAGVAFLGFAWLTNAQEPAPANWDAKLVAKEMFCKVCHGGGKPQVGNQYAAWKESGHAKAFETLKSDKAKEVAKKAGVEDPTTSGKCLRCHSTAYGFTEAKVTDKITPQEGVTCQGCHGPGEKYKAEGQHGKTVRELAAKNGQILPTEANTCSRCHSKDSPTYNAERYTTKDGKKVGFDFEQASAKIKHPIPEKK